MWRPILVCLLAASLLTPFPLHGERTRFWRQSEYPDFEKGTANGVALRSDGKLTPAPRFAQFSDPNLAYLWALRVDSQGRLYAAGGSDAKVVRFDESGKATTVFTSPELAAQAITLDMQDNLFVGTSPDGKVYKVTPQAERSVFFEPKTKYIWALAIDPRGNLFVATGDKGEVFVVSKDGKGELFYKSEEHHARSLAFDAKGNLLIGTDPNGLILRVNVAEKNSTTPPKAGAAFVVYETDKKEVTALLTSPSGDVYAATVGEKPRSTSAVSSPILTEGATGGGAIGVSVSGPGQRAAAAAQAAATQAPVMLPQFPALTGGSEVYRIAPDGSPETLWESREDLVYSLGFSPAGKLVLGTGNHGTVIELDGHDIFTNLAKTASTQVTGVAAGPRGVVYLATANPGKVFMLGPDYAPEGSFESQTFDAKVFSQWGRLTWWGESGGKAKVEFYVRSGNTSNPEKNWSAWAGPYSDPAGERAACPPARFAQWKVVFLHPTSRDAPTISWVNLAYQPKNVAPGIDGIVLENPGVRAQGLPTPAPFPGGAQPVPLRMPQSAMSAVNVAPIPAELHQKGKPEIPPQGILQKGFQSVVWSAHDDNDDDLLFSVYYRGEGEREWKLLKNKIDQRFYSWDTTTMPDGAYYLKVVASDAPSNPPDEALSTERESDRFEVDNTPPVIENLRAEAGSAQATVRFDARDTASAIARAEYSLDAGDWELAFPDGRLTDSLAESYRLLMRGLAPGEHTLALRVSDRFENSTTAKVTFTIAAQKTR